MRRRTLNIDEEIEGKKMNAASPCCIIYIIQLAFDYMINAQGIIFSINLCCSARLHDAEYSIAAIIFLKLCVATFCNLRS